MLNSTLFLVEKFETACKLFLTLIYEGLKPTVVIHNVFVRGFCVTGQLKIAYDLVLEIEVRTV